MVRTIDKATLAPTLTARLFGDVAGVTGNFVPPALARHVFDTVNVLDPTFGVPSSEASDASAGIQAALDTGKNVYFPDRTYLCNNLTSTTAGQAIVAGPGGLAKLTKNANGPILTASGSNFQAFNLAFRGEASTPTYTGDNLVVTGDHPVLVNCGSRWAYARAVRATGNHVQIYGTCDIYQTADATASGYDIEIGVSGTATLYHELHGVYTSQATGGLLFIDCGSQSVIGGEFGKYTVRSGTSPAGVNGGKCLGARVLGNVTVEISSATFAGNQFSNVVVTFAAGISGCKLDASNTFQSGASVVNNGNANNLIMRDVSTGSVSRIQFGADALAVAFDAVLTDALFHFPKARVGNNAGLRFQNAADSAEDGAITFSVAGDMSIANANTGSGRSITVSAASTTGRIQGYVNSIARFIADVAGLRIGSLATTAPLIDAGTGDPEGVKTAPIGSIWMRSDGGALTSMYVKESGTGNTGWVAK